MSAEKHLSIYGKKKSEGQERLVPGEEKKIPRILLWQKFCVDFNEENLTHHK